MHPINPRQWLPDGRVQPLFLHNEIDLVSPGEVYTVGTVPPVFLALKVLVPKDTVYIIKSMAFWVKQRINEGDAAAETARYIDPTNGDGFFAFEPLIDDASVYFIDLNTAAYQTAAGALAGGTQRIQAKGFTQLSVTPLQDVDRAWNNTLSSFAVTSQKTLMVRFRILPAATTAPMPYIYSVGGATAGTRRVDFAGVCVRGQRLTEQDYNAMKLEVKNASGEI